MQGVVLDLTMEDEMQVLEWDYALENKYEVLKTEQTVLNKIVRLCRTTKIQVQ